MVIFAQFIIVQAQLWFLEIKFFLGNKDFPPLGKKDFPRRTAGGSVHRAEVSRRKTIFLKILVYGH